MSLKHCLILLDSTYDKIDYHYKTVTSRTDYHWHNVISIIGNAG